ncbi:MAG TPA: hypothetical protein VNS58_08985 [Puia sp.]|nr:hypothetical protein [Puia sp.]
MPTLRTAPLSGGDAPGDGGIFAAAYDGKYIQVGRKWWIYEVHKLVAEGEIIGLEDR